MKSNVSNQIEFMQAIYIDACMKCSADVSDLRDLKTIKSRVKHEGLSFLTIILPDFCKDFEKSLAARFIDPTSFRNFRKNGSIPAFLQGMIGRLFDIETGRIFNEFNHENGNSPSDFSQLVESVRQICLTFKKLEISCSPEREEKALASFIEIERSFDEFKLSEEETSNFRCVSSMLWDNLVSTFVLTSCIPKHGPGATAERIFGNQKYRWRFWHDRIEPFFPLVDNGYPIGIPVNSEELKNVSIIPQDQEPPVRVVLVPKTLKSPRVIAVEPACMQYVQQGIRNTLYEGIESYWLTKGHVNFRDQSINQSLAIDGSKTGLLATIDLSDASDRVPRSLAMEMFHSNPDFRDAIDACRSTRAILPDGHIVTNLRKFASMGSALCFPIEAMYFYTICVMALLDIQNLPVTARNLFRVTRSVHIYGDDIIVPSMYADVVLDYLRKYNCKVNINKTFVSGSFRESCGVDALNGREVTPTYLRRLCPENKRQAARIVSWMATANSFYLKGYWRTATLMFNKLERIIGEIPYVSPTSAALGRISFLGYRSATRWNVKLQRLEVRALVPEPVYRKDRLGGYGALQKSLAKLRDFGSEPESEDFSSKFKEVLALRRAVTNCFGRMTPLNVEPISRDARQLERFALHGAVVLNLRWVPLT